MYGPTYVGVGVDVYRASVMFTADWPQAALSHIQYYAGVGIVCASQLRLIVLQWVAVIFICFAASVSMLVCYCMLVICMFYLGASACCCYTRAHFWKLLPVRMTAYCDSNTIFP